MVRRWSYLKTPSATKVNSKFLAVYLRKSFKSTVRFKKFSKNFSKISRKKYNLRKLSNSNYNFLMYSYFWIKWYKKSIVANSLYQLDSLYPASLDIESSQSQKKTNSVITSKRIRLNLASLRLTSSLSNKLLYFQQSAVFAVTKGTFSAKNLQRFKIGNLYFSRLLNLTSLIRRLQVLLVTKHIFENK